MDIGTGITITFASGFLAEILDVTGPGMTREAVNVSHMGTTDAHEFIPVKLVDHGEVSVEIGFAPETEPPIDDAAETITITWPNSASSEWAFTGFMTNFEPAGPLEDRMTATCTLKASGKPSFS